MNLDKTKRQKTVFIVAVVAVLLMCGFIFFMSAQPAAESDELSMGVVYRIIKIIVPGYDAMSPEDQIAWQKALNHPVRKVAHFCEYAALGLLVLNAWWQRHKWKMIDVRAMGVATAKLGKRSAEGGGEQNAAGEGEQNAAGVAGAEKNPGRKTDTRSACEKYLFQIEKLGSAVATYALISLGCSAGYAITDEIHQFFVPGRACQLSDMMLDTAGAAAGIAFFALMIVAVHLIKHREVN